VANQSTQSKHICYPMTNQKFKHSNLYQVDAISCTGSVISMTLTGKNLLIRNSSPLTVKLGYTFIYDAEVWTILPPRLESQGNIHIHDTQVRTKGDSTKPMRRDHYYKHKHNKNTGKKQIQVNKKYRENSIALKQIPTIDRCV
jgi:hypothetical protein